MIPKNPPGLPGSARGSSARPDFSLSSSSFRILIWLVSASTVDRRSSSDFDAGRFGPALWVFPSFKNAFRLGDSDSLLPAAAAAAGLAVPAAVETTMVLVNPGVNPLVVPSGDVTVNPAAAVNSSICSWSSLCLVSYFSNRSAKSAIVSF